MLLVCALFWNTVTSSGANTPSSPKITSFIDCSPPASLATIQPIKSGWWNQPSTWPNNTLPTENDDVVVPEGITLTLLGTCRARSIKVRGRLNALTHQADGTWINLRTKYIMVMGQGAELEIGTKDQPYVSNEGALITLTGNNRNELIPGTSVNSKAIMIMNGATMNLHGNPKKSWVKIGAKAPQGTTSITLAEAVNWSVGDEIVITPNRLNPNEAETRIITNISSDERTIFFTQPLVYPRIGELKNYSNGTKSWSMDTRAEVGLLSRKIKIQGGDDTTDANRYGAHVMIMNGSTGNADNVEFYRMGQGGILGRYPWHWHLLGSGGEGQYISNCSVRKSYNRAITVHGTWGTLVDNNVAYDHLGHGIFLEDGSEINNTFSNNLVLLTKKPREADALLDSDFEFDALQNRSPSSFWITNPNNTFKNNIVAGTEGTAYWFAMPDRPTGLSESLPELSNLEPRKADLKEFSGNTAHSSGTAFDANDALDNQHRLLPNRSIQSPNPFIIEDFTTFSNKLGLYTGIGDQDEDVIFDNVKSADTEIHVMFATRPVVRNSVFIADTDNDMYNVNTFDKGLTHLYNLYDGAGRIYDSHFVNWNRDYTTVFRNNGAAQKRINHLFRGITYNHQGTARIEIDAPQPSGNVANRCSQVWSNVVRDLDGSLTRSGVPNSLVSDIPFYTIDATFRPGNWKGLHSVSNKFAYVYFTNQRVDVVRKDTSCGGVDVFRTSDCELGGIQQLHLALDDGKYQHSIYFPELSGKSLGFKVESEINAGDPITIRFKGFGSLQRARIDGVTRQNSIANVNSATGSSYYVEPNGDLYARFITTNNFKGRTYIIRWNSGSLPNLTPETPVVCNDTNEPPTISFQSPSGNQFEEGDDLGVVVDAKDNDGTIVNVKLYIDDVLVRQESGAPYEWGSANPGANDTTLLNLVEGTYVLKAVATDNNGKNNTVIKTITVGNGTSTPTGGDRDGDGRPDVLENETCGNANNASDLRFDFSKSDEGFERKNITTHTTANATFWLIRADDSSDPFIVRSGLNFSGNQVPQLRIRAKSEARGSFQLYWITTDQPNFTEAQSIVVAPKSTNIFEELNFDMSTRNTWMGKTITGIRLDFPPDTSAPRHTFIDYIFGPDAPNTPCNNPPTIGGNTVTEKSTTLNVIHDVYMDNGKRVNANTVRVESGRRTGFMMFDISNINGTIKNATLEFEVFGDSGSGELLVHEGNSNGWSETNITTQNRPGIKTRAIGSRTGALQVGSTIRIPLDLSKANADRISLILEMARGNDFAFASKENGAIGKPKLVIIYDANKIGDDSKSLGDIVLYPNPVNNNILNISGILSKQVVLQIVDIQGKIVVTKTVEKRNATMDVSELESGMYVLIIRGSNLKQSILFTKK